MLLRHVANAGAHPLVGPATLDVATIELHLALPGRQLADDGLHERAFSGAVATEDSHTTAQGNGDIDAKQDLAASIAGVEMLDIEEFRHGADKSPGRFCWLGFAQPYLTPGPCPDRAPS